MQEEPHASRKIEILKKYPEIKELMRAEPLTKWCVFATVALQVCCSFLSSSPCSSPSCTSRCMEAGEEQVEEIRNSSPTSTKVVSAG